MEYPHEAYWHGDHLMICAAESSEQKQCFAPVVDSQTQLLILGSLPGDRSLAAQQYYAHPQNKFWELVGAVINLDLRAMAYEDRLTALLAHQIGLWDVIAKADRPGSLDAAIRNKTHNALTDLIATLPELRTVGFNGGTAAKIGRQQLSSLATSITLVDLPSSSPAYTVPLEVKRDHWLMLACHLR